MRVLVSRYALLVLVSLWAISGLLVQKSNGLPYEVPEKGRCVGLVDMLQFPSPTIALFSISTFSNYHIADDSLILPFISPLICSRLILEVAQESKVATIFDLFPDESITSVIRVSRLGSMMEENR